MSHRLFAIAFVSGMSVMALEITASRVVAPYFGASIFVWTNVIGIILVSLAVGYIVGSKLAKEGKANERVLSRLIVTAALLALIVPLVARPFSQFLVVDLFVRGSGIVTVFVGSFFAILILFAIPIAFLGAVGPMVISMLSRSGADAGEVAGKVFAISTLGSLIGTFAPTLITIPLLGTRATIAIFSGSLILAVAVLLTRKRAVMFAPAILIPGLLGGVHRNVVVERETPYQYVMVVNKDGEEILRTNEGIGDQSVYRSNTVTTGRYWDRMMALASITEHPRVLILGLAGGTISRGMATLYADRGIEIDGVEIDPTIVEIARERFELDQPGLSVHVEDGRVFLAKTERQYDLILVDAYANQIYIPFHMTTKEFFELARTRLAPGGILAININTPRSDSLLLRRIGSTIASVFPNTDSIHVGNSEWNYLIVGAENPIDWDHLARETPTALFETAITLSSSVRPFTADAEPLTDDRAPVELLTDRIIFEALRR